MTGVPTPDPWVVSAHDQDVRAKALSKRRTKRVLIASGAAVVIIAAAIGAYFVFLIVLVAIIIIPFWFILKKAGFSPWLALINIVPFGTLILLYNRGYL